MIKVEARFDTSKLDRMLHDFPAALARAQRKALSAIGAHVASEATQAFRDPKLRPAPWAPRKDTRHGDRASGRDSHPLLIKSGALRQSISWRVTAPDTVVVGSDKKYGPYHQFGTKNMPARPFFPIDKSGRLTPRMMRKINADVEKAFTSEMRKLGG